MELDSQSKYETVLRDLWSSSSEDEANIARTATFYDQLMHDMPSEPDSSKATRMIRWQRSSRLGRGANRKRKHRALRYKGPYSDSDISSEEEFIDDYAVLRRHAKPRTGQQQVQQQTPERDHITVIDTGTSSNTDSEVETSRVGQKSRNLSSKSKSGAMPKDNKPAHNNRVMVLRSSSSSSDSSDSDSLLSPKLLARKTSKSVGPDDGFLASSGSSGDQSKEQTHRKSSKRQKRARLSSVHEPTKSGSVGNSATEKRESNISNPTSRTNNSNSQSSENYAETIIDLFGIESDDDSDAIEGNNRGMKDVQIRQNHKSQDSSKTEPSGVPVVKSKPIPVPARSTCDGNNRGDKLSLGKTSKFILSQNAADAILRKPSCSAGRNDTVILVDITQSADRGAMAGQVSPHANSIASGRLTDDENVDRSESPVFVDLCINSKPANRHNAVISPKETRMIPEVASTITCHQNQLESDNLNSNSPEICSPVFSLQTVLPTKRHLGPPKHKAAVGTPCGDPPITRSSLKSSGQTTGRAKTLREHHSDGVDRKAMLQRPTAKKKMRVFSEATVSDHHRKGYSVQENKYLFSKTSFEENRLEWMHKNQGSAHSFAESPCTSVTTSKQDLAAETRPRNKSLQSSNEAPTPKPPGGISYPKQLHDSERNSPSFAKPPIHPEVRRKSLPSVIEKRVRNQCHLQTDSHQSQQASQDSTCKSAESIPSTNISNTSKEDSAKPQGENRSSQSSEEATIKPDNSERVSPIFESSINRGMQQESSQSVKEKNIGSQQTRRGVKCTSSSFQACRGTVDSWLKSQNCQRQSAHAEKRTSAELRTRSRSRPKSSPPAADETQVIRTLEFEQQNRHSCTYTGNQEITCINLDHEETALGGNTHVGDTGAKSRGEAQVPNNQEVINLDSEEIVLTDNLHSSANIDTISSSTQNTVPKVLRNSRSRPRSSTREQVNERNSTRNAEDVRHSHGRLQRISSQYRSRISQRNRTALEPDVRLIGVTDSQSDRRVDDDSGIGEARNVATPQSPDLEIMEAIRQMEEDEAMAKQLQERFDAKEASLVQQRHQNIPLPDLPRLPAYEFHAESRIEDHGPVLSVPSAPQRHQYESPLQEVMWRDDLTDLNAIHMAMVEQLGHYAGNMDMQGHLNRRTRPRQGRGRGRSRNRHVHYRHPMHTPPNDGSDYESLLNLAERVGQAHSKGLPESSINLLPMFQFTSSGKDARETECTICMCDYEVGETMRRLPCFHFYHAPCIDKWLKENRICPVCREEVNFEPLNFI